MMRTKGCLVDKLELCLRILVLGKNVQVTNTLAYSERSMVLIQCA